MLYLLDVFILVIRVQILIRNYFTQLGRLNLTGGLKKNISYVKF